MYPNISGLIRNNHPIVKPSFSDAQIHLVNEIDMIFSVYHAMPDNVPRLEKSRAATRRLYIRKRPHILPPRREFETTVDYYEAAMPLYVARSRFMNFNHVDNYFRGIQKALLSIFPAKLF
jgi:hypothetical protein